MNSLASELANITRNGHASLDQCIDLLSRSTAMQVTMEFQFSLMFLSELGKTRKVELEKTP